MQSVTLEQLRGSRICRGLNGEQIGRLAALSTLRDVGPGDALAEPGDSAFEIYTVISGRLKVFQRIDDQERRFIGFVNRGDTVGQSSFVLEEFDHHVGIEADIVSRVAVIGRDDVLQLSGEIPLFRRNLIESFGVRAANFFRGTAPRRFPHIVGVVAAAARCRSFLPQLCRELAAWQESLVVMTNRESEFENLSNVATVQSEECLEGAAQLRAAIRDNLSNAERVLIDICPGQDRPNLRSAVEICGNECEEIIWCCDNADQQAGQEDLLKELLQQHPEFNTRVVCVQFLPDGTTVGRRQPCCPQLQHRDLMLPADGGRLNRQGMERIVRHLRGIRTGLALGGGGARGMSHLGVLRTLDDANIAFDAMSGTSVGAMVGLAYAAGMTPNYLIESFSRELKPTGILDRLPGGRRLFLFGKFQMRAWERLLRRYFHDWTFEQLAIPFSVVVTDLISGDEVVRDSGDLVQAILESINVPVLSRPIFRDGQILVDGGVLNNLPAELLKDQGAEYVVGVDASKEIPHSFADNTSTTPKASMKRPSRWETA
ncbi:MAG: patatin-like phospholipase family protein, partial [Pirellulaceae bacterium]